MLIFKSIEDVAAAAPNAIKWFQLYIYKDRSVSISVVSYTIFAKYSNILYSIFDFGNHFTCQVNIEYTEFVSLQTF